MGRRLCPVSWNEIVETQAPLLMDTGIVTVNESPINTVFNEAVCG